jgi:hypothetical protein
LLVFTQGDMEMKEKKAKKKVIAREFWVVSGEYHTLGNWNSLSKFG